MTISVMSKHFLMAEIDALEKCDKLQSKINELYYHLHNVICIQNDGIKYRYSMEQFYGRHHTLVSLPGI